MYLGTIGNYSDKCVFMYIIWYFDNRNIYMLAASLSILYHLSM